MKGGKSLFPYNYNGKNRQPREPNLGPLCTAWIEASDKTLTPQWIFFCPYKIFYIFKAFYDLHRKEEDTFICFYYIRISIYLSINNEIKNRWSLVYTGVERTRYWGNITIFAHIFQYLLLQICIWFILVLIYML